MVSLSPEFRRQIEKDNTNLYPLVIIDPDNNPLRLSTNSVTKDGEYYAPLIMSIKSLRESIDLRKYNYRLEMQ